MQGIAERGDAGFLVELADQVEQQCSPGFGERDITQLVDDHAIQWCQSANDLPGIALGLFLDPLPGR